MNFVALCLFLTAACGYDYKDKRIPNKLIFGMAFFGAGWRLWGEGMPGALSYLGQAALIMAALYPFFRIGGLGAGDVKLLGVAAGYLPAGKNLAFLLCSLLIAAVISLVKMRKREVFRERAACLADYLAGVPEGGWKLYPQGDKGGLGGRVCLSGPVLLSALLYLGGVY